MDNLTTNWLACARNCNSEDKGNIEVLAARFTEYEVTINEIAHVSSSILFSGVLLACGRVQFMLHREEPHWDDSDGKRWVWPNLTTSSAHVVNDVP